MLSHNDHFTRLLILELHGRLAHAGIAHTFSKCRQNTYSLCWRKDRCISVWYVNVIMNRQLVCFLCHLGQVSLDWSFQLDYLGSLYVKENFYQKLWSVYLHVCQFELFICVEFVEVLSAEQSLSYLRIFIARSGKPTTYYSHFRCTCTSILFGENCLRPAMEEIFIRMKKYWVSSLVRQLNEIITALSLWQNRFNAMNIL